MQSSTIILTLGNVILYDIKKNNLHTLQDKMDIIKTHYLAFFVMT